MSGFRIFLYLFIALAIGMLIGWMGTSRWPQYRWRSLVQLEYPLLNPILVFRPEDRDGRPRENQMEMAINEYIRDAKARGDVTDVSVYYQDLLRGAAFGVNEDARFSGASLLKVPMAVAILKMYEKSPEIMQDTLVYDPKVHYYPGVNQVIEPPSPLEAGKAYTVEFLLEKMLVESDNVSAAMLFDSKSHIDIVQVLLDMGLPIENMKEDPWINVEDYAAIFRIFFNASYLSRPSSQKILELLVRAHFKQGISAGLPGDLKVANKSGERTIGDFSQLHDCGIVYYPRRPYILCLLTRGPQGKFEGLAKVIGDISKIVYTDVDSFEKQSR